MFGKTNNQGKVVCSQNNSRELDGMEKEIVKTLDNYLQLSLKLKRLIFFQFGKHFSSPESMRNGSELLTVILLMKKYLSFD